MASPIIWAGLIALIILAYFLPITLYSTWYRRVPPSKALAMWPSKGKARPYAIISGGGRFIPPGAYRTATLDLRLRFLDLVVPKVQMDKEGPGQIVRVRVGMLYKFSSEHEALEKAFSHLVDKSDKEIEDIARNAVEVAVRDGLAKTSLEKVDGDRDQLAFTVLMPALQAMKVSGLEIRSAAIAEMELQG